MCVCVCDCTNRIHVDLVISQLKRAADNAQNILVELRQLGHRGHQRLDRVVGELVEDQVLIDRDRLLMVLLVLVLVGLGIRHLLSGERVLDKHRVLGPRDFMDEDRFCGFVVGSARDRLLHIRERIFGNVLVLGGVDEGLLALGDRTAVGFLLLLLGWHLERRHRDEQRLHSERAERRLLLRRAHGLRGEGWILLERNHRCHLLERQQRGVELCIRLLHSVRLLRVLGHQVRTGIENVGVAVRLCTLSLRNALGWMLRRRRRRGSHGLMRPERRVEERWLQRERLLRCVCERRLWCDLRVGHVPLLLLWHEREMRVRRERWVRLRHELLHLCRILRELLHELRHA